MKKKSASVIEYAIAKINQTADALRRQFNWSHYRLTLND
jgi:hypothetical protein